MNRRLSADEQEAGKKILAKVRSLIQTASKEDKPHAWALRRHERIGVRVHSLGLPSGPFDSASAHSSSLRISLARGAIKWGVESREWRVVTGENET